MTTYVQELQNEIERVTLKGNADKSTIRRLASIIFRMDQRILALEGKTAADVSTEKTAKVEEQKAAKAAEEKAAAEEASKPGIKATKKPEATQ